MRNVIASVACISVLSACATSPAKTQDESTLSRTAKINAQLGIAYLQQKDIIHAKKKLLLALNEDSSIPETWYSMAYFLETTGNNEDADVFYRKAINISHHRGDTENNYGTFLCRNGKYKEAINHFLLATKDKEYITPAAAFENAGICATKIADDAQAYDYFNRALAYDPDRPIAHMMLAEIHFKKGNYKLAKNDLNEFLRLSPPTERSSALNSKLSEKLNKLNVFA